MSDLFPDNVIHEILTRLPSKSVCHFRVVSKRWSSIITAPGFLTTYISRHSPTWFTLDAIVWCSGTDKETDPVRFDFSIHSGVVNLTVNPHLVLKPDEPLSDPGCTSVTAPAEIIHSSNGLVLFAVNIDPDPFEDGTDGFLKLPFTSRFETRDGKKGLVFSREAARDVFFVVNPVTREWSRLPRPPKNLPWRRSVGLVTRLGPVGEFVLGGLHHDQYSDHDPGCCNLTCFGSETGKWIKKEADCPLSLLGVRKFMPWCRFDFRGRMCWSDPSVGIIMWDEDPFVACLSEEKAVFRFIPLPPGRAREQCTAEMLSSRCVDGAGDWIQYMEMFPEGEFAVKVWRLKGMDCEWELVYKLPRDAIEDYLDSGIIAFAQPFDPDVAIIYGTNFIFSVDLRTRVVKSCSSFLGHVNAMPYVVPSWPPSLPPLLSADYIKEQGNTCFKCQNFIEAVKCYSRSIALSPNAAAYANRALAYLKLGKFREAEEDCTEALDFDETYFKAYGRRAIAREELGNIEGALEDVDFALKLQPDSPEMKKQYDDLKCLVDKLCIPEGESGHGGANSVIDMDGEQRAG